MISPIQASGPSSLLASPREGIRKGVEQLGAAAQKIAGGDVSAGSVVQQIQAEMLVKANVVAARTTDEILGSLIDTLA